MSYLLSLTRIPYDAGRSNGSRQPDASRASEIIRATPPTPVSGLIAELFGTKTATREPVLFTSVSPGAGVTWIASAVAAELAAGGRKVLLADAKVIASLSRHEDVVALCDRVGSDQAWVLGPEQAEQSEFPVSASRGRPSAVLTALRRGFPYIVLDAPAVSQSDLAFRLSPLTAGAVLLLRKGKTEPHAVVSACRKFSTVGSQVLGCVYNAH